jgi:hypothetical protein
LDDVLLWNLHEDITQKAKATGSCVLRPQLLSHNLQSETSFLCPAPLLKMGIFWLIPATIAGSGHEPFK